MQKGGEGVLSAVQISDKCQGGLRMAKQGMNVNKLRTLMNLYAAPV